MCVVLRVLGSSSNWARVISGQSCAHVHSVSQSFLTLWSHGLWPARLSCPQTFPGKNTGVACHFLLQGIFSSQRSCISWVSCIGRQILHHERHLGKPFHCPAKRKEDALEAPGFAHGHLIRGWYKLPCICLGLFQSTRLFLLFIYTVSFFGPKSQ